LDRARKAGELGIGEGRSIFQTHARIRDRALVAVTGKGADRTLLTRARSVGIPLRAGGLRTGPLTAGNLRALGLADLAEKLTALAGRPVNFMIFDSAGAASARAASVVVPR
jgi:hypothetical protein